MRYRRVFIPGASYFFTLITHERLPIFADAAAVDLYRHAVHKVQTARPFTVEAEVILPDHIHLRERSDSRIAKGEQAVWQRRYWEHTIRDERDFQAHLDYIHINPVKHGLAANGRIRRF